ncbi:NUSAP protein, partial [Amia calva]|nr:NUSAP protein [Amia calva]
MDLDCMKYAELRRLAKDVGLKANMKAEKLLKALKEHFKEQEKSVSTAGEVADGSTDTVSSDEPNASQDPPLPNGTPFVTKRRGRGKRSPKRKHGERDSDEGVAAAQAPDQETAKPKRRSNAKKRRLSHEEGDGRAEAKEEPTAAPPAEDTDNTESQATATEGLMKKENKGKRQTAALPPGKIPRHEGLLKRTGKLVLKPVTPNFKKIHEVHFRKMESIDTYVQRKNKKRESYNNSVKEVKILSEKANIIKPSNNRTSSKVVVKPSQSRGTLFSPKSQERRHTINTPSAQSRPAVRDSTAFKPTVLSTRRVNVRFSEATKDNEHKRSLVKTPARMSPYTEVSRTPGTGPTKRPRSATGVPSTNPKVQVTTPFIFKADPNTSSVGTPGTNKKNAFDLKASLARPLGYQPHKGKLKPFGSTQENEALNKSQTTSSHQTNYKQHKVQTREVRRTKHTEDRKQKKEKLLGARRGLVMN